MIAIEPERVEWWRQLAALYLRVDDNKRALDALALAKLKGVALSQDDLRLLAQLYGARGIPERAALVLEEVKDINSDSKLKAQQATYWQIAKSGTNRLRVGMSRLNWTENITGTCPSY